MTIPALSGKTLLVTGGAGLIGSHIVDLLANSDVREIRVLDNFSRGSRINLSAACARGPVTIVEGDVRDRELVLKVASGCDYIFHQAALRITQCAAQPRECVETLVVGTLNVFEAAITTGVNKVVYASSASIYGAAEVFPTDEDHHPYNNRTIYGAAKLMNEGIARSFHEMHQLASIGLRYFNVYGPRMDATGAYTEVFIRWLDCIAEDRAPEIHGDGSATMDFVYVEDVARANIRALLCDRSDDVYNIASGRETSLLALWRTLQRVTGATHLAPVLVPPRRVNPVPRRLADTRLASDHLDFAAEVSLDAGVAKLVSWWSEKTGNSFVKQRR
jgi:UDP-glucose 4-epimerase